MALQITKRKRAWIDKDAEEEVNKSDCIRISNQVIMRKNTGLTLFIHTWGDYKIKGPSKQFEKKSSLILSSPESHGLRQTLLYALNITSTYLQTFHPNF